MNLDENGARLRALPATDQATVAAFVAAVLDTGRPCFQRDFDTAIARVETAVLS